MSRGEASLGIRFHSDDTAERDIPLLLKIADGGTPFRLDIVDVSNGTGRAYLDLEDTDTGELYRLELTRET